VFGLDRAHDRAEVDSARGLSFSPVSRQGDRAAGHGGFWWLLVFSRWAQLLTTVRPGPRPESGR